MADTRSEKWFDISRVLSRFNKNERLTFEDIAKEFGMSEKELAERMTRLAGDDEKDRVRSAWSQNKRRKRKRMKIKKAMQDNPTQEDEETTVKNIPSKIDIKRQELVHEIKMAEEELTQSQTKAETLKQQLEKKQNIVESVQTQIAKKAAKIKNLEETLQRAKAKLTDLNSKLKVAKQIVEKDSAQYNAVLAKVDLDQELLKTIKEELEGLDDLVVNLIDPSYDLTDRTPNIGRLISTVDFEGHVEAEMPDSDIEDISAGTLLNISSSTGFDSIIELRNAYEFAWLVIKYKTDPQFEVNVLTDDERIIKLIDMLMA